MATFVNYITNLFRKSDVEEEPFYDDEPVTPAIEASNVAPVSPVTVTEPVEVEPFLEVSIPYWLEDEDTLRDEGVLFGLSESDPNEKTDIIHKYFLHLVAEPVSQIEQHNERIQELNLFIGQKSNRIEYLVSNSTVESGAPSASDHHLPRTLSGLILCIAMCIGNYFLIKESLNPAFPDNPWIPLGVFLAGMFSLFGRMSIFHDKESKVSWRSLLEEVGLPFAASLFVFANALPTQGALQATALFIFVFFLFLFAGKLFLSNITLLRNDLKAWLEPIKKRRQLESESENRESEILTLQEEIDNLRIQKWQLVRELSALETERDRIYARRDMLIKLFESEFYLARRMKTQFSGKQLNYIRKSAE